MISPFEVSRNFGSDIEVVTDFIIFGAGNYNALGVLQALAEANKNCLVLCVGSSRDRKHGNIIGYSSHCKFLVEVITAEAGIDWLLLNKEKFPKGTIVYPTGDNEQKTLDLNFELLSDLFIIPNAGVQGRVAELLDKQHQTKLADKAGIRVLRSQFSNSADFSFEKVEYPCMVKPMNSTAGSKGDMRVCADETALRDALKSGKHTSDFIVQQYIKNEADLLFLGVSMLDGRVVIPALVKKPGVSPTGEYTHAIVTTDIDRYLPERREVEYFVKSLGYVGPFSIEFGLEGGKNYFFEINLRNDGTSHYPLSAGVNIPMIWYQAAKSLPVNTDFEICEYEMIDEVADLRRVLNREASLRGWLHSFRNAGSYRFYRKGDRGILRAVVPMFMNRSAAKFLRIFTHR